MRGINHSDDWGWGNAPRFGGSSGTTQTNTVTNNTPWSGQTGYLTDIFSGASDLYHNSTDWPQYYPSSTYASLTPEQNNLINQMVAQGSTGTTALSGANSDLTNLLSQGTTDKTNSAFNQGQNYLSNMISGSTLNPWSSPGFQNVVNNTLASVIPATTSSYVAGGRADSGLAQEAATQGATNAVGSLANQYYQQEQQLQSTAAQQAASNYLNQQRNQITGAAVSPSIDQQVMANMESGYNAASQTQNEQQQQLNYLTNLWNYNQELPYTMLNQYADVVGNTGYGSSSNSSSSEPYYTNTLANVSSAAGGLGSLGVAAYYLLDTAGAFSDKRLKTDIHRIGKSDSGFPVYTFRYKYDPDNVERIGLMAQDVQKKRPEAVISTPIGLMVDYAKALAV